jgi:signal transduction histidine kinase/DNA-binding response OmpR family regulator
MDRKDTILAVDDNNVNLVMLSAMLSEEYIVQTVSDGNEAETRAEELLPSLILLDIIMPGVDGLSLCRDLKNNPRTCNIPVIIVSAKNHSEDIAEGLRSGADDYLCKPFSTAELKLRIQRRIKDARPLLESQKTNLKLTDEYNRAQTEMLLYKETCMASSENIVTCTPSGKVLYMTHPTYNVLGIVPGSEVIGKQLAEIIPSEIDRENISQLFYSAISGSGTCTTRFLSQETDKDPVMLEATANTRCNKDGNASFVVVTIKKMTGSCQDTKDIEHQLLRQEKEIAGYFKYSANGIVTLGHDMEILRYNKRFLEIFGINYGVNYTGVPICKILNDEVYEDISSLIARVGKPPLFETAALTAYNSSGKKIFIEATASRLNVYDDTSLLLIFTDVTRLRNMDSEIISATVAAEERERTHLAQELHDGLGAMLSSINIYINLILSGGAEIDEIFKTLRLTKQLVGQAIESVKDIANNLHPVILTRFGLVATVNNIIEMLENSHLIRFDFHHEKFETIQDKDIELSVYRIINELISNTMKYAEAKVVCIRLETDSTKLFIYYADNGKGFDLNEKLSSPDQGGMGLSNIIGRTKAHNGTCDFQTSQGNGVRVTIEIPLT